MQNTNERARERSRPQTGLELMLTVGRLSAAADDLTELAAGLGSDAAWAAFVAASSVWMVECDGRAYRAARMAARLALQADRLRELADAIHEAGDGFRGGAAFEADGVLAAVEDAEAARFAAEAECPMCGGEAGRCASRGGLL